MGILDRKHHQRHVAMDVGEGFEMFSLALGEGDNYLANENLFC